jgi:hypothetical protein
MIKMVKKNITKNTRKDIYNPTLKETFSGKKLNLNKKGFPNDREACKDRS